MSLLTELRRRNVFRVGLFYVVSSWLLPITKKKIQRIQRGEAPGA